MSLWVRGFVPGFPRSLRGFRLLVALSWFMTVGSLAAATVHPMTIGEFLSGATILGETNLVRLQGTVVHMVSDRTFFLQEGANGVYAFHKPEVPLEVGDRVEIIAQPSLGGVAPTLQHCRLTVLGKGVLPEPVLLTGHQLLEVTNAMKLVRVRGRLSEANLMSNRALLLTPADSTTTTVVNLEALPGDELPVLPEAGSLVEATGVLNLRLGPDRKPATPVVLCRSRRDLVTLAGPSLRDRIGSARLWGLTAAGLALSLLWVWTLRRQVRRQTLVIQQKLEREAALRESEDRFAKAFRASPDPVVIARELDERVMDVNPAFERVTGYAHDDVIERRAEELGLWVSAGVRAEALQALKERGSVANLDIMLRSRSGKDVYCLGSVEVIEINGERCWLTVMRDVTERRLAEEEKRRIQAQLQESQKMEALGTLAGGIAHDFNNLLGAILGNVELLRQDLGLTHLARDGVEEIAKAGLRARDLVQQILLFSRQQTAEMRCLSLPPVVRDAIKLLRATIPASIEIRDSIDPGVPQILGNASQIQQAIMNLGTNGWHAMEDRPGPLTIELTRFEATAADVASLPELRVGPYVCVKVTDRGIGMTPETCARVFEPFFTTKEPGKGTGLGLPAVHGIVRAHDGAIRVDSAIGTGSTFTLYFPALAKEASGADSVAPTSTPPSGRGQAILVIDDEPMLVEAVKRMLNLLGYQTEGFVDVAAGLVRFQSDPAKFDLVVTDLNMPTMPGLRVIARIREKRPDIPVVLASGFITDTVREEAEQLGAVILVSKPITKDELAEVVHRALNHHRSPAPPSDRERPASSR